MIIQYEFGDLKVKIIILLTKISDPIPLTVHAQSLIQHTDTKDKFVFVLSCADMYFDKKNDFSHYPARLDQMFDFRNKLFANKSR